MTFPELGAARWPPPLPLVERKRALADLDAWWSSTSERAVVLGPSGRGKSTLLAAWVARLPDHGRVVAWSPTDASPSDAIASLYALLVTRLSPPRWPPVVAPPVSAFLSDVRQMLREGCDEGTLLLVVDDLDGLRGGAMAPLFDVLGPGLRLLGAAETRDEPWPSSSHTIELAPFSVQEAQAALAPWSQTAETKELVVAAAAGEPLWLQLWVAGSAPRNSAGSTGLAPLLHHHGLTPLPADNLALAILCVTPTALDRAALATLVGPDVLPDQLAAIAPLIFESDDIAFRHPRIATHIRAALAETTRRRALQRLREASRIGDPQTLLAAHTSCLTAQEAPLAAYAELLGEDRQRAWHGHPNEAWGYGNEVRTVRCRAAANLLGGAEDVATITTWFSAALVEVSIDTLVSRKGRRLPDERSEDAPAFDATLETMGAATDDARERALALVAWAGHLPDECATLLSLAKQVAGGDPFVRLEVARESEPVARDDFVLDIVSDLHAIEEDDDLAEDALLAQFAGLTLLADIGSTNAVAEVDRVLASLANVDMRVINHVAKRAKTMSIDLAERLWSTAETLDEPRRLVLQSVAAGRLSAERRTVAVRGVLHELIAHDEEHLTAEQIFRNVNALLGELTKTQLERVRPLVERRPVLAHRAALRHASLGHGTIAEELARLTSDPLGCMIDVAARLVNHDRTAEEDWRRRIRDRAKQQERGRAARTLGLHAESLVSVFGEEGAADLARELEAPWFVMIELSEATPSLRKSLAHAIATELRPQRDQLDLDDLFRFARLSDALERPDAVWLVVRAVALLLERGERSDYMHHEVHDIGKLAPALLSMATMSCVIRCAQQIASVGERFP